MKITIDSKESGALEKMRPAGKVKWQFVVKVDWSESPYHSGHIAYYIAKTSPTEWMLDSVQRNACLDHVTQEDVDEGALNDDQIQAMWGQDLEDAQAAEFRQIVAVCSEAEVNAQAKDIAVILYGRVCEAAGRSAIDDEDFSNGLLGE